MPIQVVRLVTVAMSAILIVVRGGCLGARGIATIESQIDSI